MNHSLESNRSCACKSAAWLQVLGLTSWKPRDITFLGLLKENDAVPDVFGPVNKAIMTDQFHRSFFGRGGRWWENKRDEVMDFADEVEECTLGKVIENNLGIEVQADVFIVSGGSGGTGGTD